METLQIDIIDPKAKKLLEDLEALNLISIRKTDYPKFQEILKKINEQVGQNLPSEDEIAAEVAEERAARLISAFLPESLKSPRNSLRRLESGILRSSVIGLPTQQSKRIWFVV